MLFFVNNVFQKEAFINRCSFWQSTGLFSSKNEYVQIDLVTKIIFIVAGAVFIKLAVSGVSLPASILLPVWHILSGIPNP